MFWSLVSWVAAIVGGAGGRLDRGDDLRRGGGRARLRRGHLRGPASGPAAGVLGPPADDEAAHLPAMRSGAPAPCRRAGARSQRRWRRAPAAAPVPRAGGAAARAGRAGSASGCARRRGPRARRRGRRWATWRRRPARPGGRRRWRGAARGRAGRSDADQGGRAEARGAAARARLLSLRPDRAWGPGEIAWVEANLEGFSGRVMRDDWVGQAKILAAGGETEHLAAGRPGRV